ncbi:sensor histidine kinase [Rheinheimera marina]|uniref:histidine kinase n=1 Tax=Rheinheimera marina TaxID=1774958 RepID=A0ABV9JFR5_9GAMM
MSAILSQSSEILQKQLLHIRGDFANALWRNFALISLFGVPLSCLRALNTGWLPLYNLHIAVGLVFVGGVWLLPKLTTALKGGLLILLFWLIGLPGAMHFGFASPGIWWLVLSCVVSHLLFRPLVTVLLAVTASLSLFGLALGFIYGYLNVPFSVRSYMTDPIAWATYLTVNFIAFVVVFRTVVSHSAALQAYAQHQFRQWVEDLPLGIVVLNKLGQPFYRNKTAQQWFGAEPPQLNLLLGQQACPLDDSQLPEQRALSGERVQMDNLQLQQGHDARLLQAWGRPGYNPDGALSFGIAVYEDITARKKLEQVKDQFVSTVSHELRTPLTSIHGALKLVLGNALGEPPEKIRAMLEIAELNSQHLIRLINDLLDIQKIEAGELAFDLSRFQLGPWLRTAVQQLSGYAISHQVSFELAEPDCSCWVNADSNRLMQVMGNLLSNAAKFSPAGAVVQIRLQCLENGCRIAIADQGPGIADNFKERIFQPFSQSDTSDRRQFGGTGLGLSISKALVEKHGGTLWFESIAGQGCTFYVDLPAAEPPKTADLASH